MEEKLNELSNQQPVFINRPEEFDEPIQKENKEGLIYRKLALEVSTDESSDGEYDGKHGA